MLAKWIKRVLAAVVLAAIAAIVVYALMPRPIAVDLATVDKGPMAVTIDEEGEAEIADVFRVSAPIAGTLERTPVHVGDKVVHDVTPIALIRPMAPAFLDVRTRRQIQAQIAAAAAAVGLAEAQVRAAESTEHQADADLERAKRLAQVGTISSRALEEATTALDTARAGLEQANANLMLRRSELVSAEAQLIEPDQPASSAGGEACCLTVKAPADGVVLNVLTESEQVVAAGTPLVEIGDPRDIQVIVHLLSSDAVAIRPGAEAELTDWGGVGTLKARVVEIDPAAYTKVSALGIEEQRVDATLELIDPYEKWKGLGHDFRVMVHIKTWESANAVRVPIGALFRQGADWHVFKVSDGKAVLTRVDIDHRNNTTAEVTGGLAPEDVVVLHPSDKVSDGVRVEARAAGA
jgi:HlyD family secretion protein